MSPMQLRSRTGFWPTGRRKCDISEDMKYISKADCPEAESFNDIVRRYLDCGKYRYDDLEDRDRIAMRDILSVQQGGLCAYCMRRGSGVTIDHVIPKSADRDKFGRGKGYMGKIGGRSLYRNDFVWQGGYSGGRSFYPHSLAYGNLVLACRECNETKDNDLVRPLFFCNPVAGVRYNEKGRMVCSPSDSMPSMLMSRLNDDSLMLYRRLWRAAALAGVSVESMGVEDHAERKAILGRMEAADPGLGRVLRVRGDDLVVDASWKRLLEFGWFIEYYSGEVR